MIPVHVMQLAYAQTLITGNGAVKNIMPHLATLFVKHLIQIIVITERLCKHLTAVRLIFQIVNQSAKKHIQITAAIMTQ